jgi:hypothetical protein
MAIPDLRLLLFPATYLVHILEECFAGERFYRWIHRISGIRLTAAQFVAINALAWIAMASAAFTVPPENWLWTAIGCTVLVNGVLHLATTILTRTYSPGVVSGVVLWIPLGLYYVLQGNAILPQRELWTALSTGVAIQAGVSLLAFALGKGNE